MFTVSITSQLCSSLLLIEDGMLTPFGGGGSIQYDVSTAAHTETLSDSQITIHPVYTLGTPTYIYTF